MTAENTAAPMSEHPVDENTELIARAYSALAARPGLATSIHEVVLDLLAALAKSERDLAEARASVASWRNEAHAYEAWRSERPAFEQKLAEQAATIERIGKMARDDDSGAWNMHQLLIVALTSRTNTTETTKEES